MSITGKTVMIYSKNIVKYLFVFVIVSIVSITNVYSQAPDCDICDHILEDGDPTDPQTLIDYAQCVEDNCDGSIPIDNHIWTIVVGGAATVYFYYRKKKRESLAGVAV